MKDQNNIEDNESKQDKWNRGLDIFIESVIKPDPALRQCAHNQRCYHELDGCSSGCVKLSEDQTLGMIKYTNEPMPLVLSLVACFVFAIGLIVAGYIHGNMHLLTTLKNAANL